jgi:hypothetical protein
MCWKSHRVTSIPTFQTFLLSVTSTRRCVRDRWAQGGPVSRPLQPVRERQSQPRRATRLLVTHLQTLSKQLRAPVTGLKHHHERLRSPQCSSSRQRDVLKRNGQSNSYGAPIHWVDTPWYLGMTLDIQQIWSTHTDQTVGKAAWDNIPLPLLNRARNLFSSSADVGPRTTSLDTTRSSTIFYLLLLNWASFRRH